MLKGYLRALIDRYYRSYEIALRNRDSVKAGMFKGVCDDLADMMEYMDEANNPQEKPNSNGKHVAMVFVGKSADFAEYLKREGVKLQ
ncbi:hypothetical protein [Clostridium hydrogenum]|uniref:hypothetical protein n=1 Tax=Clostridium hydrogenum TaxID=2855764 RepID=UPI001F21309C|nr:hypothetical protein [Clostridium hydrogenum]